MTGSKDKAVPFRTKDHGFTYDLKNITILLVEDSRPMQALIASMLRSLGVGDVMVCDGGNEAKDLLTITQARHTSAEIKPIDIIFTDWMMPDGSGIELLDWIRGHEQDSIRFLPVILLSAFTTETVITMARDHGANEALVKPVSGEKLASRILSVIERPRPFVKTEQYFGPDRRRQAMIFEGPERRHIQADEVKLNDEKF